MGDDLYSLTDLAETIAESVGASEADQQLFHRQAKNLLNQRLINATSHRGGRRDAMFDGREAAKARLQLALIDAGLDATTLRACADLWERSADPMLRLPAIDETYPPRALDAAIRDARDPKAPKWEFVIHVRRGVETGKRTIIGGFERADQPERPEEDPMSLRGPHADGVEASEGSFDDDGEVTWTRREPVVTIATIRLPVTTLIRPLVAD